MQAIDPTVYSALQPLLEGDWRLGLREWPVAVALPAVEPVRRAAGSPAAPAQAQATRPAARPAPPARSAPAPPAAPRSTPGRPVARPQPAATTALHPQGEPLLGAPRKVAALRVLNDTQVRSCTRCGLHKGRTQTVFGQGNVDARLVFVGEGPGYEEDKSGFAFVGKAGQLLTDMIRAMGLTRDDVFICNVVKCRPPGNRTPEPPEMAACRPYLMEQLRIIQPEVIVSLGVPATQTLLDVTQSLGRLRARFHEMRLSADPSDATVTAVMPTYHPAYLLRYPHEKRKTWEDLQQVMARLGLQRP